MPPMGEMAKTSTSPPFNLFNNGAINGILRAQNLNRGGSAMGKGS
jgi:hypothetical protein